MRVAVVAAALLCVTSAAAAETPRAHCRAVMQHAPRAEAIAACDDALAGGAAAEDMWAAAEVRVARVEEPTTDELIRADLLADAAARLAPGEPWGALAHLDLAVRWDDRELIERRVGELERVAPADPRTVEAVARARPSSRAGLLVGWWVLLLGCTLTAANAIWRRRTRRLHGRATRAIALAIVALLVAGPAQAATSDPFPIDDTDPERSVPTPAQADERPLDFAYYLQDLSGRADAAIAHGDHAAAVRYARALARAVPDSSLPQQRLCGELLAQGDRAAAIAACRAALGLSGVRAEDFARFGDLVLAGAAPTTADLADVEAAMRHLLAQPEAATRVLGLQLECRLGVQGHRVRLLEECTAGLAAAAPDEASTIVFQWSLAVETGDLGQAEHLIVKARAAGVSDAGLARMRSATAHDGERAHRLGPLVLLGALLAAMLAIGIALVRRVHDQWSTTISGSS